MSENNNAPAFPAITWDQLESGQVVQITDQPRLTKREKIAAMCLQGLISNPVYNNPDNPKTLPTVTNFAIAATKYADALMVELSKS